MGLFKRNYKEVSVHPVSEGEAEEIEREIKRRSAFDNDYDSLPNLNLKPKHSEVEVKEPLKKNEVDITELYERIESLEKQIKVLTKYISDLKNYIDLKTGE